MASAESLLLVILKSLAKCRLEAILIGNSAAAIHGAPVTTIDFDFMFRKTQLNLKKLKAFANLVDGIIMRPYYPVSDLYRVSSANAALQVDFMPKIHGIRSFASLRSRAISVPLGSYVLLVASLDDIIKSKQVADRPADRAVLPVLRKTLREKKKIESEK